MNQNINTELEGIVAPQLKKEVILVALKDNVIFPDQIISLDITDKVSASAVNSAVNLNSKILFSYKNSAVENVIDGDIAKVGTLCYIKQLVRMPNDAVRVLVKGISRHIISEIVSTTPTYKVQIEDYHYTDTEEDKMQYDAFKSLIADAFSNASKIKSKLADIELHTSSDEMYVAQYAKLFYKRPIERQRLLEISSIVDQLNDIYKTILNFCEIENVKRKIEMKVRSNIDKGQREYYLREQLKVIHDELGDGEEELEMYRDRIASKKYPEEVATKMLKEVNKMSKMMASSPESAVSRSYLDLLLDLPWGEKSEGDIDLDFARIVLDKEHYGLEKIKERIIEFLAVEQLKAKSKAPILCFVGPPGVGKTSIVESIARASGRKFVQMSLGGIRDEAEIRGHRRTYIGALPGRIISGIKESGVDNPIFLLDEIDKMSSDFRGDPSSALLEVLDPNQNDKFKDHFVDLPYDLSSVTFITTANSLSTIAPPLLDRMEVIELSGYTYNEKCEIAKQYLIPKQCEMNGMSGAKIEINDEAILRTIQRYTRESGVRNLEREIGKIIRKIVVKYLDKNKKTKSFKVGTRNLEAYLGKEKYREEMNDNVDSVGKVTGLAWTSVGGCTLDVEAVLIPNGKGGVKVTGNLGEIMVESVQAAVSFIRSKADEYKIEKEKFTEYDLHVHFPEGAVPKDGPSAGITVATAILSALTNKPVRSDITMTGEITLRGSVLAIGGLKEKSLAAMRFGKKIMLIPAQNEKDMDDIPSEVKEKVEIILVNNIANVFKVAFR